MVSRFLNKVSIKTQSFGINYIATGDKHFNEACISANITKSYSPDVPITLITDEYRPYDTAIFNNVELLRDCSYSYRDKISGLLQSRCYTSSIFLDSDAFAIRPISNLKSISSSFDLAACYAPVSHPPGWTDRSLPSYFPEYNTGFIFLRSIPTVHCFLDQWLCLYDKLLTQYGQTWDQASFRSILWHFVSTNKLRLLNLPSDYNVRTTKPWTISRGSYASIIHGRFNHQELSAFISFLNSDIDCFRTWAHWLKLNPHSSIKPLHDRTNYSIS